MLEVGFHQSLLPSVELRKSAVGLKTYVMEPSLDCFRTEGLDEERKMEIVMVALENDDPRGR